MTVKLQRPADDEYYVDPWSTQFLQGDLFDGVPLAYPVPSDALLVDAGERKFVSGPFDCGPAMLVTPSCAMSAQGASPDEGLYAHPVRTLLPIRTVSELTAAGAIPEHNLGSLRADRLRNYLYLPTRGEVPESAALLYMPVTMHHDLIAEERRAQLTGKAFRHLRVKLMAFAGSFLIDPEELGPAPESQSRTS